MSRLKERLAFISEREKPVYWSGLAGIVTVASPFFIAAGLSIASGLGPLADVVWLYSLLLLGIRMGQYLIAALLTLLQLKLPRLFLGGAITAYITLILTLYGGRMDFYASSGVAAFILAVGYLAGTSVYLLFRSPQTLLLRIGYATFSIILALSFYLWLFDAVPLREPEYLKFAAPKQDSRVIQAENPGERGQYEVKTFTYGSGTDRLRKQFGSEVSMVSSTVDGSAIVDDWDWSRSWLWGYDVDELPLNGHVWMPEGEGPFPIVLIVHGNHSMADLSDEGYAYLGELLASRGFISVSVDQNFLNHSTWTGSLGSLSDNMTLRAWILLQHLKEIEGWTVQEGNRFSGKVNMEKVALIGHSRGGQAAVLASNFNSFFASDEFDHIRLQENFNINTVIAIAPTDMQVDERYITASDINYLLLQGTYDADVNTFAGDRQFKRILYEGDDFYLKTSLYIRGANHGQFNTDWGRMDIGYPTQLFLNERDILAGEDQRAIAKTYVAGFLETIFHGEDSYQSMFQDYRNALIWLPETQYVSRYKDSNYETVVDYEEDMNKKTAEGHIKISTENMEVWAEVDLKNRKNTSQDNQIAKLIWAEPDAAYELDFPVNENNLELDRSALAFSLGDLSESQSKYPELEVTVEMKSSNGEAAHVKLDDHPPIPKPIETRFLSSEWIEDSVKDGGLSTSAEPVLQSYLIPIAEFVENNPKFDPSRIDLLRFHFEQRGGGSVMLDNIGFYLSPRS